jgi:hypothetical protein
VFASKQFCFECGAAKDKDEDKDKDKDKGKDEEEAAR